MFRKTIVIGYFLFACTKFCYGEVNIVELEDGTAVKVINTRVPNGKNKDSTLNGKRLEEALNHSYGNDYGPTIYLNPNVGYPPPDGYGPRHRRPPMMDRNRKEVTGPLPVTIPTAPILPISAPILTKTGIKFSVI